jgi:hypothetical protein
MSDNDYFKNEKFKQIFPTEPKVIPSEFDPDFVADPDFVVDTVESIQIQETKLVNYNLFNTRYTLARRGVKKPIPFPTYIL